MEELATYTGYAVLILLLTAVILFCLIVLYSTITTTYRIGYRKITIFFLEKTENKATYKAANAALEYLLKVGCTETQTLKGVKLLIEDFKKRYKIED